MEIHIKPNIQGNISEMRYISICSGAYGFFGVNKNPKINHLIPSYKQETHIFL
jgi:hypothetical protein